MFEIVRSDRAREIITSDWLILEWLQGTQQSLHKRFGRCELIKSIWHSRSVSEWSTNQIS